MKKRIKKKDRTWIERFLFQQKCSLFMTSTRAREREKFALFFSFSSSYTFAYLHFYTIKEVCASEWESEYPISYTRIALCVNRERRIKPMGINHAFCNSQLPIIVEKEFWTKKHRKLVWKKKPIYYYRNQWFVIDKKNNPSVIVTFIGKCQAYLLLCLGVDHVLEFSSSSS
jgi:hypothetical protein